MVSYEEVWSGKGIYESSKTVLVCAVGLTFKVLLGDEQNDDKDVKTPRQVEVCSGMQSNEG